MDTANPYEVGRTDEKPPERANLSVDLLMSELAMQREHQYFSAKLFRVLSYGLLAPCAVLLIWSTAAAFSWVEDPFKYLSTYISVSVKPVTVGLMAGIALPIAAHAFINDFMFRQWFRREDDAFRARFKMQTVEANRLKQSLSEHAERIERDGR